MEKVDPIRLSEITRVPFFGGVIPMFKNAEAAASDAIAFRIIDRL